MIIAIKEEDKVVVGYTNCETWGSLGEEDYVDEENLGIRFSKDGVLFGFEEMGVRSDIFLYDDEFMEEEITPKTVVREIIPYIKQRLEDNCLSLDKNGEWKNTLIICKDNHIYDIDRNFGFSEIDDYIAHGYKAETAISILDQTAGLSAKERILKVMEVIGRLTKMDLFPMVITDTKSRQFTRIYKGENNEYNSGV